MESGVSELDLGTMDGAAAMTLAAGERGRVVELPRRASAPDYGGMLAAVARGDAKAEDALMRALSAPLEVVLRHRARGVEGVDDLRQEALLAVLQAARAGRITEPAALVQYALQTARQLALNAQRKSLRHRTDNDPDAIDQNRDAAPSVGDSLAGAELRGCVGAVLASMPNPRDRQLLYGYYMEERPSAQLQAQFALDSAQLGKVLHRARQRFGQLWRAFKFDPPES